MRVRQWGELPQRVEVRRHVWVPARDGCRLAARVWLPERAASAPVPALLEAIPYRKNDAYAQTDERRHRYLAAHGYATVRLDLRGSGDSEGVLLDEYLPTEQQDCCDAIAWIAAQPWCDGSVGMTGLSWGGFNALQVAALRPPALKAVLAIAASDDRYTDDVHYSGGCLLASEMLPWATKMLALNARPPDPAVVGAQWRDRWLERLADTPPFVAEWLSHPHDDDYWRQGSVRDDYDAVDCPVYIVSGWSDPYRDAVLRLVANLRAPCKGLIGPWAHAYPELAAPGPAVGFLAESLRWWDHWLKRRDTGIDDEPPLRVWMPEWVPPEEASKPRPGRWVTEPCWPPADAKEERWHLDASTGLTQSLPASATVAASSDERVGADAGLWLAKGEHGTLPADQRAEDEASLTFTSEPLDAPLEILGHPVARLALASDRPVAQVAVRLCDVAPDGSSLLVTRGLRNLTHAHADAGTNGDGARAGGRAQPAQLGTPDTCDSLAPPGGGPGADPGTADGQAPGRADPYAGTHAGTHRETRPLGPGEPFAAEVALDAIAHTFPAGHRIRLSLSPAYWPWSWPSPEPVRLGLHTGDGTRLDLPVRPPRAADDLLGPLDDPETAPPPPTAFASRPRTVRETSPDPETGRHEIVWRTDPGRDERLADDGLRYAETREDRFSVVPGDPLSAEVRSKWTIWVERGEWRTRVEAEATMRANAIDFHVDNVLQAYEGAQSLFAKRWTFDTPRRGV